MVWGCIWGRGKGPIIPVFKKSVNLLVYIGVLEDSLDDVHLEVHDIVSSPVFQQDNVKIYTTKDTMTWFEKHNTQVMTRTTIQLSMCRCSWKRGWGFQKSKDIQRSGWSEKDPCRHSHYTWSKEIEWDFLEILWKSMSKRVSALLEAKGWCTKYFFFLAVKLSQTELVPSGYVCKFLLLSIVLARCSQLVELWGKPLRTPHNCNVRFLTVLHPVPLPKAGLAVICPIRLKLCQGLYYGC